MPKLSRSIEGAGYHPEGDSLGFHFEGLSVLLEATRMTIIGAEHEREGMAVVHWLTDRIRSKGWWMKGVAVQMSIRLILDESLFDRGEDTKEVEVLGSTVGECLEHAFARESELRGLLFREDRQLRSNVYIRVNAKYLYPDVPSDLLINPVKEGDEIGVAYVAGGWWRGG
jgi:hypothetical protein